MKSKPFLILAMLITTVITIVVLGYSIKSSKNTLIREKASIAVAFEPITALCMIADEKGYFTSNGLDITVKYVEGGNVAIRDMFEGKLNMVTVADNMVVFNSFKRQDFSVIATIGSADNDPRIVASKDKGIINPSDIKGKRLGTIKGTGVHYFLHLFLMKHGMKEGDINITFNDPAKTYNALIKDEVDAISTREPFIEQAVKHFGDNITVFAEPGLLIKNFNIVALNSLIKNKPGVIKKVLKALIQAEEYAIDNPKRAISIVTKKMGFSELEISQSLQDIKLKVFLEQSMLLRFEAQARWMINDKVVESADVPNYFYFIHTDSLNSLKPEAVTIIR
ncbi:ABC transporter substrate-binding protein [Candidatus Magnetomonas plexicatena]|uniref:ABC transporter substrate-binding protein n=1 Tax=Candidatus Magnetomonas plexicatena TaxID=2552947 RepID=UPI001C757DAF|nr:ABC transporter substrate-binding protein [Nitrospirales bacterium LBB_01]